MNEGTLFLSAIGFLVLFVIVFLLTREFWCWYWKINSVVALLEENNRLTAALLRAEGIADAEKRAGFVRRDTIEEAPAPVAERTFATPAAFEDTDLPPAVEPSFAVPDAVCVGTCSGFATLRRVQTPRSRNRLCAWRRHQEEKAHRISDQPVPPNPRIADGAPRAVDSSRRRSSARRW